MKKLYVMGPHRFGFAQDFYQNVLANLGFDVYHQSTMKAYYLKLLLCKYNVIWASSKARGFLTLLMKRMPMLKHKLEQTQVIIRFHRDVNAFFTERPEVSWMPYMAVMGCDRLAWVYDCFDELCYYVPRLSKSKFHVVHNGIDLDYFTPHPALRQSNTVLSLSTWHTPKKCLDSLIDAMRHLPDWQLYIAGEFHRQHYENYCKKLAKPYGDRIRFLGFVDDKLYWMQRADVFVMPSRQEAWSTQVMEAMACGCKVVAPHIGGMPQFVPDEELYALPFSPEDLAETILRVAEQDKWRRVNREQIMPYTWDRIAKETDNLLSHD